MNDDFNYDLGSIQTAESTGMDAFFASEPEIVSPVGEAAPQQAPLRIKLTSVEQLQPFVRTSAETLVHKSTNDLWAIKKDGDSFFIERLFEDNGAPLKG